MAAALTGFFFFLSVLWKDDDDYESALWKPVTASNKSRADTVSYTSRLSYTWVQQRRQQRGGWQWSIVQDSCSSVFVKTSLKGKFSARKKTADCFHWSGADRVSCCPKRRSSSISRCEDKMEREIFWCQQYRWCWTRLCRGKGKAFDWPVKLTFHPSAMVMSFV